MPMRNRVTALAAALCVAPIMSAAQMVVEVQFAPGNFGTMIEGKIKGDDYFDYRRGAKAGQEMFVDLKVQETGGNGSVYLNILPPGSQGEAIYIGSLDGERSETVPLPDDGEYTIRVYLMGNDRDAGKTVGYMIDLSIQWAGLSPTR